MTLNVCVLTATRIYQSSDFKLTIPATGEVVSERSTKIVTFQYPEFEGFVSYTGVGRWPRKDSPDTSERLAGWLDGYPNESFDDTVGRIQAKGTEFLRRVEQANGRQRHTFLVAAFVNRIPTVVVISNFESITGQELTTIRNDLRIYRRSPDRQPLVVVVGKKAAVHRDHKRALERLVRDIDDPTRIRVALMRLNERAAVSRHAEHAITESCTVVSLQPGGPSFQEISPGSRVELHHVMNGIAVPNLAKLIPGAGARGAFVRQASFGSSRSTQSAQHCRPVLLPSPGTPYELVELSYPGMFEVRAMTINNLRTVVGVASRAESRGHYQYWKWRDDTGMEAMPIFVENDLGVSINDREQIALTALTADRSLRPVLISEGRSHELKIRPEMGECGATCLNYAGWVGGWVTTTQDRTVGDRFRPAVWPSANELVVLQDLPAGRAGRVVDINEAGLALVRSWTSLDKYTIVWDVGSGSARVITSPATSLVSIRLTAQNTILGFYNDADAREVAVVSYAFGEWERLGTDPGFGPISSNDSLQVIGRVRVEGYYRPWVTSVGQQPQLLPTYRYHHGFPAAINNSGMIVGNVAADHGQHAIVWLNTSSRNPRQGE